MYSPMIVYLVLFYTMIISTNSYRLLTKSLVLRKTYSKCMHSIEQVNLIRKVSIHQMTSSNRNEIEIKSDSNLQSNQNILINIKNLLSGKGWNGKSELLLKETVAKLGLNILLAYGFVSNVSYVTCLILAWLSHGRMYGLSPLAPGQWKAFLLIYTGFFAANNVIRPLRFSLSLALTPFFMRIVDNVQKKLKVNKAIATACVVFMVNVVGTCSYLTLGLIIATKIAKVPLLP